MTAAGATATADWRVQASYFEACNCEAICPCRSVGGRPGGPSSYGECFGAISWHVRGDHCLFLVRGHLAEDSVLFQQAAELVGILGQVSRVDRSAGVRQAGPGGNSGTVSGLSSEISFTATLWAAKYSMACAARVLAMPPAVGRMGRRTGGHDAGGASLGYCPVGAYPPLACAARLSRQVSGRAVHRPRAGESRYRPVAKSIVLYR
jgi:hypothetical protein